MSRPLLTPLLYEYLKIGPYTFKDFYTHFPKKKERKIPTYQYHPNLRFSKGAFVLLFVPIRITLNESEILRDTC